MPVVIEKVDKPNAQDLIDLEKIYQDYPTDFRFSDLQNLLQKQPSTSLYAGRFNNRLIGAITVTNTSEFAELDYLCTRKITRGRNVAKELLRQLMAKNNHSNYSCTLCISDPALEHLFISVGFTRNGLQFFWQRN